MKCVTLILVLLCAFFLTSNCQICEPPCENGVCLTGNSCNCGSGALWTGYRCEIAVCNPGCQNLGVCYSPGSCNCTGTGFNGTQCQTPICDPECVHGECVGPDSCLCDNTGYSGLLCEIPICSSGCGPGQCVEPEICNCTGTGFNGTLCNEPICSTPCENGECVGPNTCDCNGTSYTGQFCQTPICSPACQNGGTCISPNVCECQPNYNGTYCQNGICNSIVCYNGFCSAPNECNCNNTGWAGRECNIDVNECFQTPPPCHEMRECINTPGSFECGPCPNGFLGISNLNCTDIDECQLGYCSELVTCKNSEGSFECGECPQGYEGNGTTCEDIDECTRDFCDPKSNCTNLPGSYDCGSCSPGYSGTGESGCEDINECELNPCNPLTECINSEGSFHCTECPNGYTGSGLENCIPECEPECNHGNCEAPNSCACEDGWEGESCSQDVDECRIGKCDPLTNCSNEIGSFSCSDCPEKYQGNGKEGCQAICQIPCDHGMCETPNECTCQDGYEGVDCSNQIISPLLDNKNEDSKTMFFGAVIGGPILAIFAAIAFLMLRKKKTKKNIEETSQKNDTNNTPVSKTQMHRGTPKTCSQTPESTSSSTKSITKPFPEEIRISIENNHAKTIPEIMNSVPSSMTECTNHQENQFEEISLEDDELQPEPTEAELSESNNNKQQSISGKAHAEPKSSKIRLTQKNFGDAAKLQNETIKRTISAKMPNISEIKSVYEKH